MESTKIESTKEHINIFFPDVLKNIWKEGDRPWDVYSTEQYRYFWDIHVPEVRKK